MPLSWKICGPAGFGIKSAGEIFAKSLIREGYFVFAYSEYPSLIRGGHNTVQVDFSENKIVSSAQTIDFLVALDGLTLKMDVQFLNKDGILLYDGNIKTKGLRLPSKHSLALPFSQLAEKAGGIIMRNSVALGASFALIGRDFARLEETLRENFAEKALLEHNLLAAKEGYDYLKKNFKRFIKKTKTEYKNSNLLFISGNEAMAHGAIVAGCKFYAGYPMTPSTAILQTMAGLQRKADLVVHQAEDEISVINSAIGASFAGARSMVATSGGGFALMTEALSLAGMSETPLVIGEIIRTAPATGLPTWTGQDDLSFVLSAGHGDFPRLVLAPGDPEEAYALTQEAFNLADKYQMPVIIIGDKFLGENQYTVNFSDLKKIKIDRGEILAKANENYQRYLDTKSGISARTLPGTIDGEYLSNSYEHDEKGFGVEGYTRDHQIQMDKRARKMTMLTREISAPEIFGPQRADLTIVSWGSNKGPIIDALRAINFTTRQRHNGTTIQRNNKRTINYIHFKYIYPLPVKAIQKIFAKTKNLLLVENNQSGQFGKLLRQETGIEIKNKFLKYNGRPFWREEIVEKINAIKHSSNLKTQISKPKPKTHKLFSFKF